MLNACGNTPRTQTTGATKQELDGIRIGTFEAYNPQPLPEAAIVAEIVLNEQSILRFGL